MDNEQVIQLLEKIESWCAKQKVIFFDVFTSVSEESMIVILEESGRNIKYTHSMRDNKCSSFIRYEDTDTFKNIETPSELAELMLRWTNIVNEFYKPLHWRR